MCCFFFVVCRIPFLFLFLNAVIVLTVDSLVVCAGVFSGTQNRTNRSVFALTNLFSKTKFMEHIKKKYTQYAQYINA